MKAKKQPHDVTSSSVDYYVIGRNIPLERRPQMFECGFGNAFKPRESIPEKEIRDSFPNNTFGDTAKLYMDINEVKLIAESRRVGKKIFEDTPMSVPAIFTVRVNDKVNILIETDRVATEGTVKAIRYFEIELAKIESIKGFEFNGLSSDRYYKQEEEKKDNCTIS